MCFVACGSLSTCDRDSTAERLRQLHEGLAGVVGLHAPEEAAVEETFVNRDPQSALRLGLARGVALLVPAVAGIAVAEYAANTVKKTVAGVGHAEKSQVAMMVKVLLPLSSADDNDASDALAVAITHAQHRGVAAMRARRGGTP